ncbi:hypothetical protein GMA10_01295 [Kocuria koreensis]|jgi:hypothetical protein|uniref:Uncharacterized protein n=1 Tax=Rothia koreensis TaxID=592378 RepID=A0A7K1LFM8_9MICC|nr:hypothetical protein [Rothia koreensis]MUN53873.1 hypothetical protein [Rothia koreensis]
MNDRTPPADDILAIDRSTKAAEAFRELLIERGYPSINEFLIDVLRDDRSRKREARLRDIGNRMFPDGVHDRSDNG